MASGQELLRYRALADVAEKRREEFLRALAKLEQALPTVGGRIAGARSAAYLNQSALAAKIGVSRGAVSQWESGATQPSAANLRKVALQTGVTYEWLGTGRGDPYGAPPESAGNIGLLVRGMIEKGTFRQRDSDLVKVQRATLQPDHRYPHVTQYAWLVQDDSASMAHIPQGAYVIGALYDEFVQRYGRVRDNSLIILERTRVVAVDEVELTIRQLVDTPVRRELHSLDPSSLGAVWFKAGQETDDIFANEQKQTLRIAAVAFGSHIIFSV